VLQPPHGLHRPTGRALPQGQSVSPAQPLTHSRGPKHSLAHPNYPLASFTRAASRYHTQATPHSQWAKRSDHAPPRLRPSPAYPVLLLTTPPPPPFHHHHHMTQMGELVRRSFRLIGKAMRFPVPNVSVCVCVCVLCVCVCVRACVCDV
jgi:hypothetical protein